MNLQFLERLEKCGKINTVEKIKLKDIIEDIDGNPRAEDTFEMLKKELKRMKVVENCEEPFTNTYYVQSPEDRSRKGKWDSKKFVRSNSRPGYFRTG